MGQVQAAGLGLRVESGYAKTRPEPDPLPFLFGMARIFGSKGLEENTNRVVGT